MRIAALILLCYAGVAGAGVGDLAWLAGTWCGDNAGTWNEEVWLPPRAGSLVGAHRDTRDGTLRGFEYFRIVEDGDALVYWTQPQGRQAVAFRGQPSGLAIDFVNPQHAFPKRIRYWRVGETLHAAIDGGTDSGPRQEWTWRRDC